MSEPTDEQKEQNGRILSVGIGAGLTFAASACLVVGLLEDIASMAHGNHPGQWTTTFYMGGLFTIPAFVFMLYGSRKKETAHA